MQQSPPFRHPLFGFKKIIRSFKNISGFFIETRAVWNFGLIPLPPAKIIHQLDEKTIQWFPLTSGIAAAADPFVFTKNGMDYIFFELIEKEGQPGKIAFCTYDGKHFSTPVIVLVLANKLHTSYPFLFSYQEDDYLITENYQSGRLILYKAEVFPAKWNIEKEILEEEVVDATVFYYNEKFWLFYTLEGKGRENHDLYIRYAGTPQGPWLPHLLNPVKSDKASARPAGALFMHSGRIFRPSQNCSAEYGNNIVINEVLSLTETRFEEKEITTMGPLKKPPYVLGFHTLNGNERFTLIDAKKIVRSLRSPGQMKKIIGKQWNRLINGLRVMFFFSGALF